MKMILLVAALGVILGGAMCMLAAFVSALIAVINMKKHQP